MKKTLLIAVFTLAVAGVKAQTADSTSAKYVETSEVYLVVDTPPEPIGGIHVFNEYVAKNMKYPEYSRMHHITGKVIVSFIVEKDGSLTHPEVIRKVSRDLDVEAIRIINEAPKWKPGMQNGHTVRVKCSLPFIFIQP